MKIINNIFVIIISLLISMIFIELMLSILFPQFNPSTKIVYYTNPTGVILGPINFKGHLVDNSGDFDVKVSFNKYGFRDKKDLSFSTDNDIFVVGDSFSFGYGVEEDKRFSDVIESLLHIKVYNICIPGNFNDYEKFIKYAEEKGAHIKNIIIGVCMENDLSDYSNKNNKQKAYEVSKKQSSVLVYIKNVLEHKSTTYNILAWVAHTHSFLRRIAVKIGIINEAVDVMNKSKYNETILKSSALKLKEVANDYNAIILIIPSRSLWMGDNKEIESVVHSEFVRLVRNEGLEVVDMQPIFEASGNPMQYHFPNNGHWNAQGHLLAAEAITARLQANGFIHSKRNSKD